MLLLLTEDEPWVQQVRIYLFFFLARLFLLSVQNTGRTNLTARGNVVACDDLRLWQVFRCFPFQLIMLPLVLTVTPKGITEDAPIAYMCLGGSIKSQWSAATTFRISGFHQLELFFCAQKVF